MKILFLIIYVIGVVLLAYAYYRRFDQRNCKCLKLFWVSFAIILSGLFGLLTFI